MTQQSFKQPIPTAAELEAIRIAKEDEEGLAATLASRIADASPTTAKDSSGFLADINIGTLYCDKGRPIAVGADGCYIAHSPDALSQLEYHFSNGTILKK